MDENKEFRQVHKVPVKKTKKPINKKAIAGLVLAIILAAGCIGGYYYVKNTKEADYVSKVTDGSKDLITGDATVSKQGYYEYLMDGSGASEIVSQALTNIANKELTTKADKTSIETETKALEDQYKNYMGSVKDYAKSVGYSSEEAFRKATLTPNAKQNALVKKYLTSKFTTAINKYKVSYVKYFTYEKESQALKTIQSIKSEDDYKKLAEASSTSNDVGILSTKSSADSNLVKKASAFYKMKKDGVYGSAVKLSTGAYAVVYVYNTDRAAHKDDIVSALYKLDKVKTDINAYYLNKYHFTVYDNKMKKAIKEISKSYIKD